MTQEVKGVRGRPQRIREARGSITELRGRPQRIRRKGRPQRITEMRGRPQMIRW